MTNFTRISTTEAARLVAEENAQLVDIRDEQSFTAGHINSAQHIGNHNIQDFINNGDCERPLVVYCYHGNSSQSAAAYFAEQGFTQSLQYGWRF